MTSTGTSISRGSVPSIKIENDNIIFANEWGSVVEECKKTLEPQDQQQFDDIKSPSDFWSSVLALEDRCGGTHPIKILLESLHPTFRQYEQTSHTLTQALDQSLEFSLVWGLLFLSLKSSVERDEILINQGHLNPGEPRGSTALAKFLKGISQRLEYFDGFTTLAAPSHRLKQTAVEIHVWLVQFLSATVPCFRDDLTGDLSEQSWLTVKKQFEQTIQNLDEASKHLERLNLTASMQSSSETTGGLHRLVNWKSASNAEQIKLPFENLPNRRNPHFYGREDIIDKIERTFKENSQQAGLGSVTLHGLGGIGKSQTALEYAHRHRDSYEAVFWVKSDTEVAITQDLSRIAYGLGLEGAQEHEDARNKVLLLDWLHMTTARWLLIFNNAVDAKLIEEAFPTAGVGDILVTARASTVGFQLGSKRIEVKPFSPLEGSKLILRLLDRESDPKESASAEELASKLNGHALAISQMAALMKQREYSIRGFNTSYSKQTKEIHRTHGKSRPDDYDLFLDTVWELSFKSLNDRAKEFLGILTFLNPDSIPQQLFLTGGDGNRDDLLGLPDFCSDEWALTGVEASVLDLALMEKLSSTGQLSLHRLVQTEFSYSLSRDKRQEAFDNASRLLHRAFPKQVNGRLMHADWPICQIYRQHVLSLVHHFHTKVPALDKLRANHEFCKLLCNTCWFLSEYDSPTELRSLLDIAFDAFDSCEEAKNDKIDLAHLYNTKGVLHLDQGAFQEAQLSLDKCKEIRCEVLDPDHEEQANIYNNLGNLAVSLHKYSDALTWQTKAEQIRMKGGEELGSAKAMSHLNLGRALWFTGDHKAAITRLNKAVVICTNTDSWYLLAHTYLFLGTLSRLQADTASAKGHYHAAKKLMLDRGQAQTHSTTSVIYYKLGCVAYDEREYEKAVNYIRSSLIIAELNAAAKGDQARVLRLLACALERLGGHEQEANEAMKKAKRLRKDLEGEAYREDDQSEVAYDNLVCGNHR